MISTKIFWTLYISVAILFCVSLAQRQSSEIQTNGKVSGNPQAPCLHSKWKLSGNLQSDSHSDCRRRALSVARITAAPGMGGAGDERLDRDGNDKRAIAKLRAL